MTTEELQAEIKKLIRGMGWSLAEAARHVFWETEDSDDEDEIRRHVETFKKKLSRPSTPPEHLEAILSTLCRQKAAKLVAIKPVYVPGPSLAPSLRSELRAISREIDPEMEDEASPEDG
jgi:hypothetical protein